MCCARHGTYLPMAFALRTSHSLAKKKTKKNRRAREENWRLASSVPHRTTIRPIHIYADSQRRALIMEIVEISIGPQRWVTAAWGHAYLRRVVRVATQYLPWYLHTAPHAVPNHQARPSSTRERSLQESCVVFGQPATRLQVQTQGRRSNHLHGSRWSSSCRLLTRHRAMARPAVQTRLGGWATVPWRSLLLLTLRTES